MRRIWFEVENEWKSSVVGADFFFLFFVTLFSCLSVWRKNQNKRVEMSRSLTTFNLMNKQTRQKQQESLLALAQWRPSDEQFMLKIRFYKWASQCFSTRKYLKMLCQQTILTVSYEYFDIFFLILFLFSFIFVVVRVWAPLQFILLHLTFEYCSNIFSFGDTRTHLQRERERESEKAQKRTIK